jgi:DNA-binding NtrC family response regulator
MKGRILLLDDDKLILAFMEEHLTAGGYDVTAFDSPIKAIEYLKLHPVDLLISDVKMDEMTGDEVFNHVREHHPDTGVILITGFGNINHSVNAMSKGAFDYITKPFTGQEFTYRVRRYFDQVATGTSSAGSTTSAGSAPRIQPRSEQKEKAAMVSRPVENRTSEIKFVGESAPVKRLMQILPKISRNNAPILIQSESGTGKEVFAQLIHVNSGRSRGPYIKINCANLPTELVESTLFGHMKGAFTGAISDQKGAFDEASGGTLLLDEITEIGTNVQAKLLRVLQEREFQRVGSQKPVKVDVRVIATSNRNIGQAINEGKFRADLYYRLNVFPITIPPLRDRREDIPMLAEHFVEKYTSAYGFENKQLDAELMDFLMVQEWKGNVRELDNMIHRGVVLSHDETIITLAHVDNKMFANLDEDLTREVLSDLPLMPIEEMELQLIKKALEKTQGNQKKAAELLGISDRTIRNKLKI